MTAGHPTPGMRPQAERDVGRAARVVAAFISRLTPSGLGIAMKGWIVGLLVTLGVPPRPVSPCRAVMR